MKFKIIIIFILLFSLLMNVFSPIVQAYPVIDNTGTTRSGKTILNNSTIRIDPDPRFNTSMKLNIGDGKDYDYLNYNLTIKPFLENNTDIAGILQYPELSPFIFNTSVTSPDGITIGTVFNFKSQFIMSGVSELWVRMPVLDISLSDAIRVRIARIIDISTFNVTYSSVGTAIFSDSTNVRKIYDVENDPNENNWVYTDMGIITTPNRWYDFARQISIPVKNESGITQFYYNFTYLRVEASLFSNEWYYIQFDVYNTVSGIRKIAISPCDFANDNQRNIWIWSGNSFGYAPFDPDISMILTCGLSNGIGGIGNDANLYVSRITPPYSYINPAYFHFNISYPVQKRITTNYSILNILIPFLINQSSSISYVRIYSQITLYGSYLETTDILNKTDVDPYDANWTYSYLMYSWNISDNIGDYLDHIRVDVYVRGDGSYWYNQLIKFWGTRKEVNWSDNCGFTDMYFTGDYNIPAGDPVRVYSGYQKIGMIPYGVCDLFNGTWVLTNKSIIVIPINTPNTIAGIEKEIANFNIQIAINKVIDTYWRAFNIEVSGLVQYVQEIIWDILKTNPVLMWFLTDILPVIASAWEFIYGICIWLYSAIQWAIDALEWFAYWGVRAIYSFSICAVYIVNVMGVISINSALLAVARTGEKRDFVRAFKSGWNFCYAIISFLIGLAILAVSIVGAVVPL